MPRKVITRTGKPGATANDRRILVGATGPTAEPVDDGEGQLLNRNEFIHFLFEAGGTSPVFNLQVWWYSFVSGRWHRGEALVVNNDDLVTIEVQGLNRVFLQVTAVSGTSPTLDAWLALVVPV